VATICVAPARRAATTSKAPIGPQPVTSTRLPSNGPARCTACSATENGSTIALPRRSRWREAVRL